MRAWRRVSVLVGARPGPQLSGPAGSRAGMELAIAGFAFACTIGMLAARGFGTAEPQTRGVDALGVLIAAASTLPLVARWRAPMLVFLLSAGASVLLLHLRYGLDLPVGPLFATYALAVRYSGHDSAPRRVVAMIAVGTFVPAGVAGYGLAGVGLRAMTAGMLAWVGLMAGIWIAGDRSRLRTERLLELEDRARRMERDAERERRLAAAEERTRIARELHDSAGHAINVILVQAGAARLLHERQPAGSRAAIATIEQVASGLIGEIDLMVRALRDDSATGAGDGDGRTGGPAAVAEPVDRHRAAGLRIVAELVDRHRAAGLRIVADLPAPMPALPRSVAWAAYRILQESLTNAARHGTGSAVLVVRPGPDAVEITVTNPAAGGVPAGRYGHGIVGMRERATLLGGTLDAGQVTPPGSGANGTREFRVHARLPYDGPAAWQRFAS